jgi:membrane protein insertase Oxa1/YidC/SpoIIIJ
MKNAARMKLAQPHLDKLKDEMEAAGTRDPNDLQKFRKKYKDILAKYQVRPLAGMLVPMSQVRHTSVCSWWSARLY